MNFHYVRLSQEILMLIAQDGGRIILLTYTHYQLDINK